MSSAMNNVREWLDSLGLDQYADAFEESAIDLGLLTELDHELLVRLQKVPVQ